MSLIDCLSQRLKHHPKRIVFPEGTDPRILKTARKFADLKLGIPILLGNPFKIQRQAERCNLTLDGIRILKPDHSDEIEHFMERLQALAPFQSLPKKKLTEYVLDHNYFATLMLATSSADALVSGATVTTSSALRPLFEIIPLQESVKTASSMLILETNNPNIGIEGVLFMADCNVMAEPTPEQLADIAVTLGSLSYHLTDKTSRVALLSHTSKEPQSETIAPSIVKVKKATQLAKEKAEQIKIPMEIDGELQVDTALDAQVAAQKNISGPVAGRANVLIFPDLNSGNIASKMVSIISDNVYSYGQILTGLNKPAAEISRGASVDDIFGTAVLVGCQAVDHRFLFGAERLSIRL